MEHSSQSEKQNPIQVADRLFGALEYLAESGPASLQEVTEALDLNKSTVHRLLMSLQYLGYVRQTEESGKYELTLRLVTLSQQLLSRIDIIQKVHPFLEQLKDRTGETVHFVRRDGADVIYIDKVESDRNSVQMVSRIGSRLPIYRSGVGKAIAATLDDKEVGQIWAESEIIRATPYTITDYSDYLFALQEVRQRGYALDNEENEPGVRCVAASLAVTGSKAEYAFSISAPVSRMDNDRIRELAQDILWTREQIREAF